MARAIGSYPIGRRFKSDFRYQRPVGQVVKTPPFHGSNMGSSPVRVTKKQIRIGSYCAINSDLSLISTFERKRETQAGSIRLRLLFVFQCVLSSAFLSISQTRRFLLQFLRCSADNYFPFFNPNGRFVITFKNYRSEPTTSMLFCRSDQQNTRKSKKYDKEHQTKTAEY